MADLTVDELHTVHNSIWRTLEDLDFVLLIPVECDSASVYDIGEFFEQSYMTLRRCNLYLRLMRDQFAGDSVVSFLGRSFSSYHKAVVTIAEGILESITHTWGRHIDEGCLAEVLFDIHAKMGCAPRRKANHLLPDRKRRKSTFAVLRTASDWLPIEFSRSIRDAKNEQRDNKPKLNDGLGWINEVVTNLSAYSEIEIDAKFEPGLDMLADEVSEWNTSIPDREKRGAHLALTYMATVCDLVENAIKECDQFEDSPVRDECRRALVSINERLCNARLVGLDHFQGSLEDLSGVPSFEGTIRCCKDTARGVYLEDVPELVRLANELQSVESSLPDLRGLASVKRPSDLAETSELSRLVSQKDLRSKLGISQNTLRDRLVGLDIPVQGRYRHLRNTPSAKLIQVVIEDVPASLHNWLREKPRIFSRIDENR